MDYNATDAEIKNEIIKWLKMGRKPQYVVMGHHRYSYFCTLMLDYIQSDNKSDKYLLSEFLGLKIIVVASDIFEVVLEPDEMFLALHGK